MSKAWFVSPNGELVALGQISDLRICLDDDARNAPLIHRTELSVDLKLTADQWNAWAQWERGDRRYLRLRRQHKAKGRGLNWRNVA